MLVPAREALSAGDAIRRVEREGKRALSMLDDEELARFVPIEGIELPEGPAYLLVDVDTGHETRNVTPDDALVAIRAAGRSPLTIEEGIAVVTHHPETIARNDGWSLLGLALRRPPRRRAVDQQGRAQARLVLGRQPAHLARVGLVRGAGRRSSRARA